MLSIKNPLPEINFQDANGTAHDKLLQTIKSQLPQEDEEGVGRAQGKEEGKDGKEAENQEQKSASFQVGISTICIHTASRSVYLYTH